MRVAIVGGGISGLTPLWLLHHFSEHEVEIFEQQDTFGGDAYTVPFQQPGKEPCWTDTAFVRVFAVCDEPYELTLRKLVFNRSGWPNFVRFLEQLRIPITRSADSLSVTHRSDGYTWGSTHLSALFCCLSNVFSGRTWSMAYDLFRLHYSALDVLRRTDPETAKLSVGEWLDHEGYGRAIRDDYIIPFVGALWSVPPPKVASEFPVTMFVRAFHNQRLLQLFHKDPYLSIAGGSWVLSSEWVAMRLKYSRRYLDEIVSSIPPTQLHSSTSITAVRPNPSDQTRVDIVTSSGETRTYDHVVLALHPHVIARICSPAIVGAGLRDQLLDVEYTKFDVWMHYDESSRPANPRVWAAWNVYVEQEDEADAEWVKEQGITPSTVGNVRTFDCNLLQGLDVQTYGSVLGTLNPTQRIDTAKVVAKKTYEMPVMSAKLRRLAGTINQIYADREESQAGASLGLLHPAVSLAGAWQDQGFHEDGFVSGFKVAQRLGAKPPFELVESYWPVEPPSTLDRVMVYFFVTMRWIKILWTSLFEGVSKAVRAVGRSTRLDSERWEVEQARRLRRWSNSSVIKEKEA